MKYWVLDVPFEWRMHFSRLGIKYHPEHKVCYWYGAELPEHLKIFRPGYFSLEWHAERKLNPKNVAQVKLLPPWQPRKHQEEPIELILKEYKKGGVGFALADDVGLGKTLSAWYPVVLNKDIKNVLIVSILSALPHWRNTILRTPWSGQEVTLINYDRLSKLFEEPEEMSSRKKGKRKRIVSKGEAPGFDYVIWDESHKGKNRLSARGAAMRAIEKKSKFSVWASATLGESPIELGYMIPLLSQQLNVKIGKEEDFELWCSKNGFGVSKGDYGKWVWDGSQESKDKIKRLIFENPKRKVGIRRLPQEIAGWPEIERQIIRVNFTPQQKDLHSRNFEEFKAIYLNYKRDKKSNKKPSMNPLVEQLRFRQKTSLLLVDSTVEQALNLIEQGKSVAISVYFKESMEEIKKKIEKGGYECAVINGDTKNKEEERLRFQKEEVKCVLYSVEEAISLHEGEHGNSSRINIVHDMRWVAKQMIQIEGRCHRDGKFAPVMWMVGDSERDEKVAENLLRKIINMKGMHGDDTTQIEEVLEWMFGESNE